MAGGIPDACDQIEMLRVRVVAVFGVDDATARVGARCRVLPFSAYSITGSS
jgi:hypothetical protein